MSSNPKGPNPVSRRRFLKTTVANGTAGIAAAAAVGLHPKEAEAYEIGKKIFYFRGGPHDFSCASCHGADNQRIRLQDLPN